MPRARHTIVKAMSFLAILSLLAGCGALPSPTAIPPTPTVAVAAPVATPAPPTTTRVPPTATALPLTTTPVPPTPTAVPPTATPIPVATLGTELVNLVKPSLPKPAGTPGPGNMDVSAMQLSSKSSSNLWAAFSTGFRPYQPDRKHFVAIYSREASGWKEISKVEIECGDYLSDKSVKQVQIEPSRVWIQVEGGVGAHSGCFNLLSFDGKTLRSEASSQSSSAGAGRIQDINGDGIIEAILDQTDYYVFCYACGVRYFRYQVLRWDGAKLSEVKLTPLADSAPADLRKLTNQAVTLAQAGLWKDAQETITQALALKSSDTAVAWNAGLIKLHGDDFAKQAASGPYPLLDHIFYGDYPAALNVMRPYTPEQLFGPKSVLLSIQIAQGWEKSITGWITETTTLAIAAKPDLAAAYFLRGWGINLTQPASPAALADLEKAVQLAPNETLFSQGASFVKKSR